MNKFEQVSSDHHQMSLGRGRGTPSDLTQGRGSLPCNLSDRVDNIKCGQTDACENITFPLLRLCEVNRSITKFSRITHFDNFTSW